MCQVEKRSLGPRPVVSELRDVGVEGPEGVSPDQKGRTLSACQPEVGLEEVRRHDSIALEVTL